MKMKVLGVAAVGLLLTACAHAYPDLAKFELPPPENSTDLGKVLNTATQLQKDYSEGYKETARWQDLGQLPIIGGAAAAAWVLLNAHANAAKMAGKIGIATTTYAATRGQLIASGMPDIYIAGYGALTCILAEGPTFNGDAAQENRTELRDAIDGLRGQIAQVNDLRYTPVVPSKDQVDALKAAYAVADQALAGARTAQSESLKQLAAFDTATPVFRNAVSAVSVAVASKGRARQPVDFAALRDKMIPKTGGGPGGAGQPTRTAPDVRQLIQKLMAETSQLTALTAELAAGTPDYLGSLNRVKECPTQVH